MFVNTNISFFSEPDQGIYDAMNKGLQHATNDHDYVLFLNSGDIFSCHHALSIVAQVIEASCLSHDVYYGHTLLSLPGSSIAIRSLSKSRRIGYIRLNIPMHHQSIYLRLKSLHSMPYDTTYRYAGDYELIARMYREGRSFHSIDYPLSTFDMTGASFNPVVQKKSYRELAAIQQKYFYLSYVYTPIVSLFFRLVNLIRRNKSAYSACLQLQRRLVQFLIRLFQVLHKATLTLRYNPRAVLTRFTFIGLEHRAFMSTVSNEVNHVIDVGMNKGQFLLAALQYLHISEYDGFEPIPSVYHSTIKLVNDLRSCSKIRLHNLALAKDVKKSSFHQSHKSDCSSLLEPLTNSHFNNQSECIRKFSLDLSTLDTIISPDNLSRNNVLLKIDTQGTELNVLRGAENLLKSGNIKHIYVEVSEISHYKGQCYFKDILDYLNSLNYLLKSLYNTNYTSDGQLIFADAYFVLYPS
jgi:FkbM family methyltransferase